MVAGTGETDLEPIIIIIIIIDIIIIINIIITDLEPGTVIVAILIRTGRGRDPGTGLGVRDLCWEQHSSNSEKAGI